MEKIILTVEKLHKDLYVSKYKIFGYHLAEEKNSFLFSKLTFTREDGIKHKEELDKLMNEYGSFKTLPFALIMVFSFIAILIITSLLILFLTNREIAKSYWLIFLIPSGLSLIAAMICTFLKLRFFDELVKTLPEKNKEFIKRVKELEQK